MALIWMNAMRPMYEPPHLLDCGYYEDADGNLQMKVVEGNVNPDLLLRLRPCGCKGAQKDVGV